MLKDLIKSLSQLQKLTTQVIIRAERNSSISPKCKDPVRYEPTNYEE